MRIVLENVKRRTLLTPPRRATLFTTDINVLPDPGNGKAWSVKQVLFRSNAGTAAAGGNIRIRYNGTTTNLITAVAASSIMPAAGRATFVQALSAVATASQAVQIDASAAITANTSTLEVIVIADKVEL